MLPPVVAQGNVEYLESCAIIRDDTMHSGFKTHADIRKHLGDEKHWEPNPRDKCGYLTNTGRFLDRREARVIGYYAGQCNDGTGELLSCDVRW